MLCPTLASLLVRFRLSKGGCTSSANDTRALALLVILIRPCTSRILICSRALPLLSTEQFPHIISHVTTSITVGVPISILGCAESHAMMPLLLLQGKSHLISAPESRQAPCSKMLRIRTELRFDFPLSWKLVKHKHRHH